MNIEFFLKTFRTKSHARMLAQEKDEFANAVGYSEDMPYQDLVKLYNDIHAFYDIEMDEMEEDEANEMMPTYQLVMRYMRKYWFHLKN